jgi:hypothetical protein
MLVTISHGHPRGAGLTFPCSPPQAPWSPQSECRPGVNYKGGERAVSTAHKDKLSRLVGDDEGHAESHGLWAAIKERMADEVEHQMAMEALIRGVPLEMAASLTSKPTGKVAWDQLESSRLSSDHARMSSTYHVRRQYENIVFHDGESLNDFAL